MLLETYKQSWHAKWLTTSTWSTRRHCCRPPKATQQNSGASNNKTSQRTKRLTSTAPPTSAPTASVSDSLHVPLHVGAPRHWSPNCGPHIGIGPVSKTVPVHVIKACGVVEVQLHWYLISTLDGGQFHASGAWRPRKGPPVTAEEVAGCAHSRTHGRFGERKHALPLPWLVRS